MKSRAALAAAALVAALTATSAQAATLRHCGTVASFQLVVHRGSIGCPDARHVVQAFRKAERKSTTIDGWRCESGTGGGGCIRGGSSTSSAHGWIEWFYEPHRTSFHEREEAGAHKEANEIAEKSQVWREECIAAKGKLLEVPTVPGFVPESREEEEAEQRVPGESSTVLCITGPLYSWEPNNIEREPQW